MNVIFLDFDGVLDTIHYNSDEDIENKIMIPKSGYPWQDGRGCSFFVC